MRIHPIAKTFRYFTQCFSTAREKERERACPRLSCSLLTHDVLAHVCPTFRCKVCKRLSCERCSRTQPCLARSLLHFVASGHHTGASLAISGPPVIICRATVLGAKELPPTMRVLCMDLGVILVLAHDHPEAIAYSAEATVA